MKTLGFPIQLMFGDRLRDDHPGRYQLYFNSDTARIEIDFLNKRRRQR
jgi:hypothetical protein